MGVSRCGMLLKMKQPKPRKEQKYPELWMYVSGGLRIQMLNGDCWHYYTEEECWGPGYGGRNFLIINPDWWTLIGEIK